MNCKSFGCLLFASFVLVERNTSPDVPEGSSPEPRDCEFITRSAVHYLFKLDDIVSDGSAHTSLSSRPPAWFVLLVVGTIDFSQINPAGKSVCMCQNRVGTTMSQLCILRQLNKQHLISSLSL